MEKQALPTNEKVYFDRVEKELEFDAVLPEYCPNIAKIVKLDAYPKLEGKSVEQNGIFAEGSIVFKLVYISDFKSKLKCVTFSSDYSHDFHSPGIAEKVGEDGFITVVPFINAVNAKMINPRKLVFKTKISLTAEAQSCAETVPYMPSENQNMELLYKDIICCKTTRLPDTSIKVTEDIIIESEMPPVAEIIFADANVYIEEIKAQEQSSPIKAYAIIKCLYEAESGDKDECEYVSMQKKIPLAGEIETEGLEEPFEISAQITLTSLSAEQSVDTYGENRIITCNFAAEITGNAFRNDTFQVCEDGFSADYLSKVSVKPFVCDQLVKSMGESLTVTEKCKADLKEISDIVEAFADIKPQNAEIMEDKVILNGKAKVSVIGCNAEGDMESFETTFPFHAPMQGAPPENSGDMRVICCAEAEQVNCHIENGELVVTLTIAVRCLILKKVAHKAVYDIEEDEENPRAKCPGEMTIYYPCAEDTLWTVAKKYGMSPEAIKNANRNVKENLEGRKIVLIPCFK